MQKIGLIGAGNMGGAILKALVEIYPLENIYISEAWDQKLQERQAEFNLLMDNCSQDPNQILSQVDVVIMAVKPQSFEELCQSLTVDISAKLIVSIMAGISIEKMQNLTKSQRVIRSMPNLCISVAKGLIGWMPSAEVSEADKNFVVKVFESMAQQIELKSESMIDSITALSGSGPAYYFYLCELMQEKAIELGFDEQSARKIAEATFIGSALTLEDGSMEAKQWREAVTSKGGTTEAALKSMMDNGFGEIFKKGIQAAKNRSAELNG